MSGHCRLFFLCMITACGVAWPGPARAESQLRPKLGEIAKGIQKFLEGRGENRVAVGQFTGPAEHETNAGPGIEDLLAAELKALGLANDRKANFSVKGDYLKVTDKNNPNLISLRLKARIFDKQANEALVLDADINATQDLARLLAATASLPPLGDRQMRNEDLQKQLDKPPVHLDGTRILVKPDGLLGVELLVKPSAQAKTIARAPMIVEGQAFVDIRRDELYEVRLYNYHPRLDAAVTLSIDGLDVFTFSDLKDKSGRPRYTHFIVGPSAALTVPGWHKSNEKALSFLVTEYGQGAASQARQARGKVGVLTATYSFAWAGDDPPAEEKGARDASNETGFGPPRKTELQEITRHTGILREAISVRYTR